MDLAFNNIQMLICHKKKQPTNLLISELEHQLRYYVHFQTNTHEKVINHLIFQLFFYMDDCSIKYPMKVDTIYVILNYLLILNC